MAPTRQRRPATVRRPAPVPTRPVRRVAPTPTTPPASLVPLVPIEVGELTVRAAFVGILLVAAFLRLIGLDDRPLQRDEVELALQSLSLMRGEGADLLGHPWLVSGNALLILMLGASDGVVRLLPAVAGTLAVGVVWLFRGILGNVGMLVAAALLAISPTFLFYSRTSGSAMLASATILAAAGLLIRLHATRQEKWAYALAVVVGLFITSGPLAWAFVAALVLAALLATSLPREGAAPWRLGIVGASLHSSASQDQAMPGWLPLVGKHGGLFLLPAPESLRRAGLLGAAVAGLVATAALTNLRGIQDGVVDSLALWWSSLTQPGENSLGFYLLHLLSYDMPTLIGIAGAVVAIRRRAGVPTFLALWAMAAFLLATASAGRPAEHATTFVLPLLLLAGWLTEQLVPGLRSRETLRHLGLGSLAVLIISSFTRAVLGNLSLADPDLPGIFILAAALALFILIAGAVWTIGTSQTLRLAALIGLALSTLVAIHATANLNFGRGQDLAVELFVRQTTSPDIRTLAGDVFQVGQVLVLNRKDKDSEILVEESLRNPLAWYLRDVKSVQFVGRIGASPAVAVMGGEAKAPRGAYAGQRYTLTTTRKFEPGDWKTWWRWWTLREPAGAGQAVRATVFVKAQR
ncbi:MAG: glycosyltransferase family 39 protein [Chloroflexi bacterium]|nr:glycosyltransferase family 39 protein [Chloroflexota bacterium]